MGKLIHPIQIGPVRLQNNLALAPLSGTTNRPFRYLCRRFGAGLVITELVNARGICHDPSLLRNWRYLAIDPDENPVGIQLFGSAPSDFSQAIHIIFSHPVLSQCSLVDLNMGCPVAKVIKSGAGAALMRTPDLAARIIEASVQAARIYGKPVTVKFRKGWDDDSVSAVPFARMCEASGAAALTLHGRTRAQMYKGAADWQIIGEAKAAVGIPVFGNGNVCSAETAACMIRSTGADGIMIGRAAQGHPWIFREIIAGLMIMDGRHDRLMAGEPSPDEKLAVLREHLDGLVGLLGEPVGVREMRSQLAYYFRGTPGGARLKNHAMLAKTQKEVIAVLEDWHRDNIKSCENS